MKEQVAEICASAPGAAFVLLLLHFPSALVSCLRVCNGCVFCFQPD